MTWLVAVDPGIDAAGVATFQLDNGVTPPWRPGEPFERVMARLGPTTVLRTKPSEAMLVRLRKLSMGFAAFTELPGLVTRILLEEPAAPGAYAARGRRQRTKGLINAAALVKLYVALGVLVDAALCCSELRLGGGVELVPAPRTPKKVRHDVVTRELVRQNHLLVQKGRLSPDLLDAIYIGAAWLSDPRRAIERAIAN